MRQLQILHMSKKYIIGANLLLALCLTLASNAQPLAKGLLWEITGNGLTKPSYLYGTMHVSSKLAFNLSDSFFIALKNVDQVALESTPENWLEEFLSTEFMGHMMRNQSNGSFGADNKISADRFSWFKELYTKDYVKQALSEDPAVLNQLMFRHTSNKQDFEEDTYLDLYIFQTASRLGKPVVSVEELDESLRLVMEAYTNIYDEDKERKYTPNFDELLEEYYRQADLQRIDSLLQKQGYSNTYLEKMLYIRNRNMVKRMDSMMRKEALFTGVGASHLPGNNGVIKLLTNLGYTLRAVNQGNRNAQTRSKIDKIKVPVEYRKFQSADGAFSVNVPGKLLVMPGNSLSQQYLLTDMMNGAYYSISRIRTLAPFLGVDTENLLKTVDSLLYENIPGTILSKKEIIVNGHKAIDISNKNRRGDLQRYRIVITPFELYVVKTGGRGAYVKENGEQFITSFTLNAAPVLAQNFESKSHGFKIAFPSKPLLNYEASSLKNYAPNQHIYTAADSDGVNYFLLHQSFINTSYLEEDTVELNLIESGVIDGLNVKETSRKYINNNGYLTLQCNYNNSQDVACFTANYAIRGSHVYVIGAWYSNETGKQRATGVLSSFTLTSVVSEPATLRVDSAHFFTVNSCVAIPPDINRYDFSFKNRGKNNHQSLFENIDYFDAETGERVSLDWQRVSKYFNVKDTAAFWKQQVNQTNYAKRYIQTTTLNSNAPVPNATVYLKDTNSSRMLIVKILVKGRNIYKLTIHTDTLTKGNNFQREFLASFNSFDTTSFSLFVDKTPQLLSDLVSNDSATYAQARALLDETFFLEKNHKKIVETINKLADDKYKKNLQTNLIDAIGSTQDNTAIPYLKTQYQQAGDDYDIQFAILKALLNIKSSASYLASKELLLKQTPFFTGNYEYGSLFNEMVSDDTTWLRKPFLPDLLKLTQFEEYKNEVYELLADAIDSNKITYVQYQPYLNAIIVDAKKALTKELTKDKEENNFKNFFIDVYNHILIKHMDLPQVREYFDKQLKIKNSQVKINTVALLLAQKKFVADSIVYNLAQNINTRLDLYKALANNSILDKMPAAFNTQQQLVQAYINDMVKPRYGDNKLDTIIFLQREKTYFRGKTGFVYFYKYKLTNTDQWNTYTCGLQPLDTNSFSSQHKLSGNNKEDYNDSINTLEQFKKAIAERKEIARSSGDEIEFAEEAAAIAAAELGYMEE